MYHRCGGYNHGSDICLSRYVIDSSCWWQKICRFLMAADWETETWPGQSSIHSLFTWHGVHAICHPIRLAGPFCRKLLRWRAYRSEHLLFPISTTTRKESVVSFFIRICWELPHMNRLVAMTRSQNYIVKGNQSFGSRSWSRRIDWWLLVRLKGRFEPDILGYSWNQGF